MYSVHLDKRNVKIYRVNYSHSLVCHCRDGLGTWFRTEGCLSNDRSHLFGEYLEVDRFRRTCQGIGVTGVNREDPDVGNR